MSDLTPIGARLELDLDEEFIRIYNDWFCKWHYIGGQTIVEIDGFGGGKVSFCGVEFRGSPQLVFWDRIQKYARKQVSTIFDKIEIEIREYPYSIASTALDEIHPIVVGFISSIRHNAAKFDNLLSKAGFDNTTSPIDRGQWRGARPQDIEKRYKKLKHILELTESKNNLYNISSAIYEFSPDANLVLLISSIERDFNNNDFISSVDRIHTYCMKYFSYILSQKGIQCSEKEPLNARFGKYLSSLSAEKFQSEMTKQILKNSIGILEKYNYVRNRHSFAHDNVVISQEESRFIAESMVSFLNFVRKC